jgi:hypothetical protein
MGDIVGVPICGGLLGGAWTTIGRLNVSMVAKRRSREYAVFLKANPHVNGQREIYLTRNSSFDSAGKSRRVLCESIATSQQLPSGLLSLVYEFVVSITLGSNVHQNELVLRLGDELSSVRQRFSLVYCLILFERY